ncbi:MAG: dTDP-4-dehydrorhamnose 3,5-epimerase family protein [Caldilineaceae bacterium]|nr:dTDP-4-dehydrorhamnose 3,5-epimerase family protein [Caldilineaceae bacterium]
MATMIQSEHIADVKFVQLKAFGDERGRFLETFRKEWFPERSWEIFQTNRSDSAAGVLRGLHYHFHQIDYWYAPVGTIRVALADIRRSSPTYLATEVLEIGGGNEMGIYIPSGVAHGFVALTAATLTYIVDQYYNAADELGVAWNDPKLAINWGVAEPILSGRDQENPLLADIAPDKMPG